MAWLVPEPEKDPMFNVVTAGDPGVEMKHRSVRKLTKPNIPGVRNGWATTGDRKIARTATILNGVIRVSCRGQQLTTGGKMGPSLAQSKWAQ
jgi:hypothetical protein